MKTEYTLQDKMRDLIDDNNLILLVLSRFGIHFGFGDSTIGEVCRENDAELAQELQITQRAVKKKLYRIQCLTARTDGLS